MYAIIDIETTGTKVLEDKITEIAIYIHDGDKITDSFHSLINPERWVPSYITQLTGITNEMLEDAPKFYEVAKNIVQITKDKVFVAHNAHFDYTFVKNEFKNLGYMFQRKTLCTVRLSRKIIPGLPSYSLSKLCKSLNIPLNNHHRAQADAKATFLLFDLLLQKDQKKINKGVIDHEIKAPNLPPKISIETFNLLPEETGVYYLHNEKGDIIYVGKSKNIKKRIATHFGVNLKSKKTIELKNQVADISYELTGSELVALLYESSEIKKYKPVFNRAQRRTHFHYGIFSRTDTKGYIHFFIDRLEKQSREAIFVTQNADSARKVLYNKVAEYTLCMKLCGLYQVKGACFDYQIKKCQGACIREESMEDYNIRAQKAIESFDYYARKSFMIVSKGRTAGEKAIVCIEHGKYLGFGYIDNSIQIHHLEDAKNYIHYYQNNKDIQKIIRGWLKKYTYGVIIFSE